MHIHGNTPRLPVIVRDICFALILILGAGPLSLPAQQAGRWIVEGYVQETGTNAPVAYAHVYATAAGRGVITNEEGWYRIILDRLPDTLRFSSIGYSEQRMAVRADMRRLDVPFSPMIADLPEAVVRGDAGRWLYKLVASLKRHADRTPGESKVYFGLKTWLDGEQGELVEGFHNAEYEGQQLLHLQMRRGRFALRFFEKSRMFRSIESSQVFAMFRVFGVNRNFPDHPLHMSAPSLMRNYHLHLHAKFAEGPGDTILIIDFAPRREDGEAFSGRMWVQGKTLRKLHLNCEHCQPFPLYGLEPESRLLTPSMNMTFTWRVEGAATYLQHLDFQYRFTYTVPPNQGMPRKLLLAVESRQVLFAFDHGDPFIFPRLSRGNLEGTDYRVAQYVPYNEAFWSYMQDRTFSGEGFEQDSFYTHPEVYRNHRMYPAHMDPGHRAGQHDSFILDRMLPTLWSAERAMIVADTEAEMTGRDGRPKFSGDFYRLDFDLLMDIVTREADTVYQTYAIFDRTKSFYHHPTSHRVQCFFNMLFDLVEIHRRELQEKLDQDAPHAATANAWYDEAMASWQEEQKRFRREVYHGKNDAAMLRWNAYITEKLGIDNLALIGLEAPQVQD